MFKKLLYLETKQNLVWTSMQEILPHIKDVWSTIVKEEGGELVIVDVDSVDGLNYQNLFDCDAVICSAFNLHTVGFLKILRGRLGMKMPLFFYLHGLATVGLWPLLEFGLWPLLTKSDSFLGTCQGDMNCLDLLNIDTGIETFFASKENTKILPQIRESSPLDIVYIGRISHQKNLEILLKTFKKLKSEKPSLTLHLYGEEDHLDHPNFGLKRGGYQRELESLGVEGVVFHGFSSRDEIKEKWRGKDFIFCSPSLHSDENFGMAALMALELGGRLVLSDWGGHQNFKKAFPSRVVTVKVYGDEGGLYLKEEELYQVLKGALKSHQVEAQESPFNKGAIIKRLREQVKGSWGKQQRGSLETPSITKELCANRLGFINKAPDQQQRIYSGPEDKNYKIFASAYGAIYKN